MGEKKITKAEQRKMDAENKKEFITAAFQIVLNGLAEATADITGSEKMVQIKFTSRNRYIYIDAYGMSAGILIFKDGNIDLSLKEALHNTHSEHLFEYSPDKTVQAKFLLQFQKMMTWLLPECFENGVSDDFHTFMDYVDAEETVEVAYKRVCEEWGD